MIGMIRWTIDQESTSTAIECCVFVVDQLIGVVQFSISKHGEHKPEWAAATGSETKRGLLTFNHHHWNFEYYLRTYIKLLFHLFSTALVLIPLLKKALIEDASFKKECLCTIAKQFDVNQVSFCSFDSLLTFYVKASLQHSYPRQWNWRRRHELNDSPQWNIWLADSSGPEWHGKSMHEEFSAHVHVDPVFCKWNLSIYVFEYPILKTIERRLKLAREQAYDMGISHWWKFLRHVRLIDINFSGVPRMAKFGHWNRACRRTRRSPSADDTAHDFLVLPQSHCPQECGKVGECTNAFNDVNTFILRYRLKKSILRLDPNTFGLHENENNVLSHATKAVKTIRRRVQASYTAQTTLRRILITRVRMLR